MADLIYGINAVSEGLRSSRRKPLSLVLQRDSKSPRLVQLQREAESAGVPVARRDRRELDRLVGHGHHQGALLEIEPFAYLSLEELLQRWRVSEAPAFFLVLDGITDPHNLGAILRSADGAGCHGVIVTKDRACPVTGVVDKVSAGALEHVPLCQVTNLARTLDALRKEGVWVYGLAGEEGASPLYDTDLCGDLALVVGSEGTGLRPNTRSHCDLLLAIPLRGKVSSLNASVATSVALFEAGRQRRLPSSDN
ncbi:23S rRNA (guanosine(2251)-2'-O)-methyltransferase RlmB [Syntrophotalea acetylenivorans]|uniref:23S rRNA (Guanosine(2251)-2'-O)-methyltransferase RlmB n=1 Tax=Syntrophotalea acetylenivorans TaxID=1842532 RepID=A0A1L3GP63_9BACT|nr:23S rRNA (guanosine(2251)-2'-O)-methyltransferase RlmB [Syntrophotalea acetylenivorans]APG27713.1 23S rRNA (guanosine(2251)-2'-O)-methyltransferase RlmB [Syntrophotalea acetylenivorans]